MIKRDKILNTSGVNSMLFRDLVFNKVEPALRILEIFFKYIYSVNLYI